MRCKAKAFLSGKFIVLKAYIKKQGRSQINSLTLHLKELKKEQMKSKVSRSNEMQRSENKRPKKQKKKPPTKPRTSFF